MRFAFEILIALAAYFLGRMHMRMELRRKFNNWLRNRNVEMNQYGLNSSTLMNALVQWTKEHL